MIGGVTQMNRVQELGRSYGRGWVKGILRRESYYMCSQRHIPKKKLPCSVLTSGGKGYGMPWLDRSAHL